MPLSHLTHPYRSTLSPTQCLYHISHTHTGALFLLLNASITSLTSIQEHSFSCSVPLSHLSHPYRSTLSPAQCLCHISHIHIGALFLLLSASITSLTPIQEHSFSCSVPLSHLSHPYRSTLSLAQCLCHISHIPIGALFLLLSASITSHTSI